MKRGGTILALALLLGIFSFVVFQEGEGGMKEVGPGVAEGESVAEIAKSGDGVVALRNEETPSDISGDPLDLSRKVHVLGSSSGFHLAGVDIFTAALPLLGVAANSNSLRVADGIALIGQTNELGWFRVPEGLKPGAILFAAEGTAVSSPALLGDSDVFLYLGVGQKVTISLSAEGRPVSNAEIELLELRSAGNRWVAETEGNGSAQFEKIPPGAYMAIYSGHQGAGFVGVKVDKLDVSSVISLTSPRTIRILLTDERTGDKVSGAKFSTMMVPVTHWEEVEFGVYECSGFPRAIQQILFEVEATGYATDKFIVVPTDDENLCSRSIALPVGRFITGRLFDQHSRVVSGAKVIVAGVRWDGESLRRTRVMISCMTVTQIDGSFRVQVPSSIQPSSLVCLSPVRGFFQERLDKYGTNSTGIDLGDCFLSSAVELDLKFTDMSGAPFLDGIDVRVAPAGIGFFPEVTMSWRLQRGASELTLNGVPGREVEVSCLRGSREVARRTISVQQIGTRVTIRVPRQDSINVVIQTFDESPASGALRASIAGAPVFEEPLFEGSVHLEGLNPIIEYELHWLAPGGELVDLGFVKPGRGLIAFRLLESGGARRIPVPGD
jgi:hypothetical protein